MFDQNDLEAALNDVNASCKRIDAALNAPTLHALLAESGRKDGGPMKTTLALLLVQLTYLATSVRALQGAVNKNLDAAAKSIGKPPEQLRKELEQLPDVLGTLLKDGLKKMVLEGPTGDDADTLDQDGAREAVLKELRARGFSI